MLVKVKNPFYDENGLHKIGETVEVKELDEFLMEEVKAPKKEKTETKIRLKG